MRFDFFMIPRINIKMSPRLASSQSNLPTVNYKGYKPSPINFKITKGQSRRLGTYTRSKASTLEESAMLALVNKNSNGTKLTYSNLNQQLNIFLKNYKATALSSCLSDPNDAPAHYGEDVNKKPHSVLSINLSEAAPTGRLGNKYAVSKYTNVLKPRQLNYLINLTKLVGVLAGNENNQINFKTIKKDLFSGKKSNLPGTHPYKIINKGTAVSPPAPGGLNKEFRGFRFNSVKIETISGHASKQQLHTVSPKFGKKNSKKNYRFIQTILQKALESDNGVAISPTRDRTYSKVEAQQNIDTKGLSKERVKDAFAASKSFTHSMTKNPLSPEVGVAEGSLVTQVIVNRPEVGFSQTISSSFAPKRNQKMPKQPYLWSGPLAPSFYSVKVGSGNPYGLSLLFTNFKNLIGQNLFSFQPQNKSFLIYWLAPIVGLAAVAQYKGFLLLKNNSNNCSESNVFSIAAPLLDGASQNKVNNQRNKNISFDQGKKIKWQSNSSNLPSLSIVKAIPLSKSRALTILNQELGFRKLACIKKINPNLRLPYIPQGKEFTKQAFLNTSGSCFSEKNYWFGYNRDLSLSVWKDPSNFSFVQKAEMLIGLSGRKNKLNPIDSKSLLKNNEQLYLAGKKQKKTDLGVFASLPSSFNFNRAVADLWSVKTRSTVKIKTKTYKQSFTNLSEVNVLLDYIRVKNLFIKNSQRVSFFNHSSDLYQDKTGQPQPSLSRGSNLFYIPPGYSYAAYGSSPANRKGHSKFNHQYKKAIKQFELLSVAGGNCSAPVVVQHHRQQNKETPQIKKNILLNFLKSSNTIIPGFENSISYRFFSQGETAKKETENLLVKYAPFRGFRRPPAPSFYPVKVGQSTKGINQNSANGASEVNLMKVSINNHGNNIITNSGGAGMVSNIKKIIPTYQAKQDNFSSSHLSSVQSKPLFIRANFPNLTIANSNSVAYFEKLKKSLDKFVVHAQPLVDGYKFNLKKSIKDNFSGYINSPSILMEHYKMFKKTKKHLNRNLNLASSDSRVTSILENRLFVQKKRKAKKQRLETRRQKKRTRFFPRPIWLRFRLFSDFLNKRNKLNNKSEFTVASTKNKFKLNSFSSFRGNTIKIAKKGTILTANNPLYASLYQKGKAGVHKGLIIPEKENNLFYQGFGRPPVGSKDKKSKYNKVNLKGIKDKANYVNFKSQKQNNPNNNSGQFYEGVGAVYRDLWIWAYNTTQTNKYNQLTDLLTWSRNIPYSVGGGNVKAIKWSDSTKAVPAAFRGNTEKTVVYWAFNKTFNKYSSKLINKRNSLWSLQKLRNQSKNNKTALLSKQIQNKWDSFFLNKNLTKFNKKIFIKMRNSLSKFGFIGGGIGSPEISPLYKLSKLSDSNLGQKGIGAQKYKLFESLPWWAWVNQNSPTILLTPTRTSNPGIFYLPNFNLNDSNKLMNMGPSFNLQNNLIITPEFWLKDQSSFADIKTFWIVSATLFHFCAIISLISISEFRCFIKFHLILIYKLSNVYSSLIHQIGGLASSFLSKKRMKKSAFGSIFQARNALAPAAADSKNDARRWSEETTQVSYNPMYMGDNSNSDNQSTTKQTAVMGNRKAVKTALTLTKQTINPINKVSSLLFKKPLYTKTKRIKQINTRRAYNNKKPKTINNVSILPEVAKESKLIDLKKFSEAKKNIRNGLTNKLFKKSLLSNLAIIKHSLKYNSLFISTKTKMLKTVVNFIDLVQYTLRSISAFGSAPAEFTTTWIAYSFLIEWSSDFLTIIPENLDVSIWTTFSKNIRVTPIANTLFLTTSAREGTFTIPGLFTLLNGLTISHLIQRRVMYFFDYFIKTLSQPDTDLIRRRKKGILFWDIWADFLLTAADQYNINIAALSTIKAEQNNLIQQGLNFSFSPDSQKPTSNINSKGLLREGSGLIPPGDKVNLKVGTNFNNILVINFNSASSFNRPEVPTIGTAVKIKTESKNILNTGPKGLSSSIVGNAVVRQSYSSNKVNHKLNGLIEEKRNPPVSLFHQLISNPLYNGGSSSLIYQDGSGLENNRWAVNQYITYQSWHPGGGEGDLFIDYHPPKSFLHLPIIKYNNMLQQPIGTLVCQIYSGKILSKVSKNILLVNQKQPSSQTGGSASGIRGSIDYKQRSEVRLIQALAGETELKLISDNAKRYAIVNRGFAIGIKLLRDVFDKIKLNTPCIFLLEDIHLIGEKRPMLISDYAGDENKTINELFMNQRDEVHEKNQVIYQNLFHSIVHYKKPFKGDYSSAIPTNKYLTQAAPGFMRSQTTSNLSLIVNTNTTLKSKIASGASPTQALTPSLSSHLQLKKVSSQLTPPANSPFSVLLLKDSPKELQNKVVQEFPWVGLPGAIQDKPRISYSVRAKVAMLAELSLSNVSAKLDMITDLLVIIDSVRGNKGFIVFATTDTPQLLDPALRRPGRLDETICLPDIANSSILTAISNYEIIKIINPKNLPVNLNNNSNSKGWPSLITVNLMDFNATTKTLGQEKIDNSNLSSSALTLSNALLSKSYNLLKKQTKFMQSPKVIAESLVRSTNKHKTSKAARKSNSEATKKLKSLLYYEVGKYILTALRSSYSDVLLKSPSRPTVSLNTFNTFNLAYDRSVASINYLAMFGDYSQLIEQLMSLFSGKISVLLSNTKNKTYLQRQLQHRGRGVAVHADGSQLGFSGESKKISNLSKQIKFSSISSSLGARSLDFYHINDLKISTSLMSTFVQKRYLYHKNLIVPKMLSFNDGAVLDEPPSPPFSNLLIPAKRFENYKRLLRDSIFGDYMGSYTNRKAIDYNDKIQPYLQLASIKQLKEENAKFINTVNSTPSLNKDLTSNRPEVPVQCPAEGISEGGFIKKLYQLKSLQNTTNMNWYYQNRILKRHSQYLINQWWTGQLSEHNAETVFLSDIDWRSSFIKSGSVNSPQSRHSLESNKNTQNLQSNSSNEIKDVLLDFPDADQHYNPRRRRWLLNKGDWAFWFNFEKVYSEEILKHIVLETLIKTYTYLHNNTELLDYMTTKFMTLGYQLPFFSDQTASPSDIESMDQTKGEMQQSMNINVIPESIKEIHLTNSFKKFY